MHENNFEKEVQERLNGLLLTPSEPVWQKVAAAIKKKRERRRMLWLLPMALLAGGFTWWALTGPAGTIAAHHSTKPAPQRQTFSKPHRQPSDMAETNTLQALQKKQSETERHAARKKTKPATTPLSKLTISHQTSVAKSNAATPEFDNAENTPAHEANHGADNANSKSNRHAAKPSTLSATTNKERMVDSAVQKKKDTAAALQPDSAALKTSAPQKIVLTKPKARLQWSLSGRAGSSNLIERLFAEMENKSAQRNVAAGSLLDSSAYSFTRSYKTPAAPQKGAQFSIGLSAKRSVGKSRFVTLGVNYAFYRSHLLVGTALRAPSVQVPDADAEQKAFRNNGAANRFTNQLHFIEVPVGFQYRLMKKHPLYLQHGLAVSQLLHSRVLQYDSNTDAYYQDVLQVQKTGIHLFTEAAYTLWHTKTMTLQAGPQVQYALRNLFEHSASPGRLVSGGVAVNMVF